ncbi:16950_t:CDS:2, partial [Gigaspora rosea]
KVDKGKQKEIYNNKEKSIQNDHLNHSEGDFDSKNAKESLSTSSQDDLKQITDESELSKDVIDKYQVLDNALYEFDQATQKAYEAFLSLEKVLPPETIIRIDPPTNDKWQKIKEMMGMSKKRYRLNGITNMQSSTQSNTQTSTQSNTQMSTQSNTQMSTQSNTQMSTQSNTQMSTQSNTQMSTQSNGVQSSTQSNGVQLSTQSNGVQSSTQSNGVQSSTQSNGVQSSTQSSTQLSTQSNGVQSSTQSDMHLSKSDYRDSRNTPFDVPLDDDSNTRPKKPSPRRSDSNPVRRRSSNQISRSPKFVRTTRSSTKEKDSTPSYKIKSSTTRTYVRRQNKSIPESVLNFTDLTNFPENNEQRKPTTAFGYYCLELSAVHFYSKGLSSPEFVASAAESWAKMSDDHKEMYEKKRRMMVNQIKQRKTLPRDPQIESSRSARK